MKSFVEGKSLIIEGNDLDFDLYIKKNKNKRIEENESEKLDLIQKYLHGEKLMETSSKNFFEKLNSSQIENKFEITIPSFLSEKVYLFYLL